MLKRIATALWGKFESSQELKKFLILAGTFCLIIGVYWALRGMKDGIFGTMVGFKAWQPYAKMLSLFFIVPLILVYTKLINTFERHKVFYIIVGTYATLALLFAAAFMHPTIGLENTVASPYRLVGWAWYLYVESFGSLIVALFWAITVDTTAPDSAKRGFPMIALLGQIGNIFGPYLLNARRLGFDNSAPIVAICGVMMFIIAGLMWYFINFTPKDLLIGFRDSDEGKSHEEPGFFDGLKLLLTKGYLFGIFLIIAIYEIVTTILDFHFKSSVYDTFATEVERTAYLNYYGTLTGIVATACVLLGINSIQRRLGMRASLLLLPILVGIAVVAIWLNPTTLQVALVVMVLAKAINYALNQPTLKQLYIPTSEDSKYKAQAWIEMFGSRGSKATGSIVNGFRSGMGLSAFLAVSSLVSGGLIGLWFFVAIFVARTYNKAVKEKIIVC
jgi:AAA family ATP:ADP antiporter